MKTLGLIGGMSYESTLVYYKLINQEIKNRLGGLNSARLLLYSVNFEEIMKIPTTENWEQLGSHISDIALTLEKAGAQVLALGTNTVHKIAPQIMQKISVPFVHIIDATGEMIRKENIKNIGLLGTKTTMSDSFYKDHLKEKFNLNVFIPPMTDQSEIHRIIFEELCHGIIKDASRSVLQKAIGDLQLRGCSGIILGCTELPMIVRKNHPTLKIFDTTEIHARACVDHMLKED
ncbi:MAG: aspartate/glutamate racemase [Bdellovibrionales bacterium RIFOXYB1_FULL_37_110]|nr:MAG: aspartate/glutamate racemase [Bdellovibrionales bacterium RIFOXYC1_FULL_37_79]OFZ58948.1 MAG: aspartate/glutamate racemase [Bdellovibrionales bacterium RIFOXYB1_FULL_37_110]OFZ64606.1 MAG: aspartate/glutamate racemase [Bdellovibrionales bacterium RIFOXYD1_FULL_36_51]